MPRWDRLAAPAALLAAVVVTAWLTAVGITERHLAADRAVQQQCSALAAQAAGIVGAVERMTSPPADSSED